MKLYLLTRPENNPASDDEYIGAVVCAESKNQARMIHPNGTHNYNEINCMFKFWIPSNDVIVTYLGEADKSVEKGVILDSSVGG